MSHLRILSSSEQVAEYLRNELKNQTWSGKMPGGDKLARELGVGTNTIEAALKILESEGWLVNQGRRRGRLIQVQDINPKVSNLRICILLGELADRHHNLIQNLISDLENEGYNTTFASKSQVDLNDDVTRISRLIKKTPADAWVICSGTRETLEWFAEYEKPSFALFGRANQLKIPSIAPDKVAPLRVLLKKLVDLGHRRIVNICRPMRRLPEPGLFEREFLEELERLGISTGPYNLPDWDENIESFHRCLDSLFSVSPPTALIIDEGVFVTPTLQYCIRAGLRVPEDFSIVCTDPDPSFAWCKPSISHIKWDSRPIVRRVLKWAKEVSAGREDYGKNLSKAKFIEGGTVGPAKK
ncbi:MAG: substrate-binding domain-containing protein [Akkermansiaceae bacterium]